MLPLLLPCRTCEGKPVAECGVAGEGAYAPEFWRECEAWWVDVDVAEGGTCVTRLDVENEEDVDRGGAPIPVPERVVRALVLGVEYALDAFPFAFSAPPLSTDEALTLAPLGPWDCP